MSPRLRAAVLVLGAAALLAMPALALAHAELGTATPVPGSRVEVAPAELVVTFTEPVDGAKSSLEVRGPSGAVVAGGGADILAADEVTMTLPLPALANGMYEVRWTAAALDGHIERGTFEFTVAVAASPSPSPSPSPGSSPSPTVEPSPSPEPSRVPSPSPAAPGSESPDGGSSGGGGEDGLDLGTLVPIVAVLVVVGLLGAWFAWKQAR